VACTYHARCSSSSSVWETSRTKTRARATTALKATSKRLSINFLTPHYKRVEQ
jgi:hypothetical protein